MVVDRVTAEPIELIGPEAVGRFIGGAIERFGFFELAVLNARINVGAGDDPDRARGRVFITEIRQDRQGAAWSHTYGVYHDTYRRVGRRLVVRRSGLPVPGPHRCRHRLRLPRRCQP